MIFLALQFSVNMSKPHPRPPQRPLGLGGFVAYEHGFRHCVGSISLTVASYLSR